MEGLLSLLTANNIIFVLLSAVILGGGLLSVLTEKLMHAAFYLFLTLVGIAGLYLQMNYNFLAAAQLSVYAGGILMLFLFAIVLVHRIGENSEKVRIQKKAWAGIAAGAGILLVLATMFLYESDILTSQQAGVQALGITEFPTNGISMKVVGQLLLNKYLLPFEATGILLLACIIGALVIANKEKEVKE